MAEPQLADVSQLNVRQVWKNNDLRMIVLVLLELCEMIDEARVRSEPEPRKGKGFSLEWVSEPTPRIHIRFEKRNISVLVAQILQTRHYQVNEDNQEHLVVYP
jgi:hypothetical protein